MSSAIDLARTLAPQPDPLLRQGIVTAVSGLTCSVQWSGSTTASVNQRSVGSYLPRAGDVVFGVRDGSDMLVIGPVNKSSTPRRIGWNQAPPGSAISMGVSTTPADIPYFGIECGAVPSGHIIEVRGKVWAAQATAGVECYLLVQVAENNSGTRSLVDECRWIPPSGSMWAPSPIVMSTFRTWQDYTNLTIFCQAILQSGSGTFAISSGDGSKAQHSQILVTDWGYSAGGNAEVG